MCSIAKGERKNREGENREVYMKKENTQEDNAKGTRKMEKKLRGEKVTDRHRATRQHRR